MSAIRDPAALLHDLHVHQAELEAQNRELRESRQVDSTTTRMHGGLGLGLSIAQYIVGLHAGRVWGESAGLDRGSTFVIELPSLGPG